MGLGPSAIKLYLELWQRGLFRGSESVVEMGSQDLALSKDRFEGLVTCAGIPIGDVTGFEDLVHWPYDPRMSARHFYELLGFANYNCIDLNNVYGAIPHDLNQPFADGDFFNSFDLVTDHGTNEHVFNIAETYRTMHNLCRPGGLISIQQCLYGGNGYHNFDLSFFEGMAAANNYQILFSSFIVTLEREKVSAEENSIRGIDAPKAHKLDQFHIPLSNDLIDSINWTRDGTELGISYVFKKNSDEDFKYAYPGEYQCTVQSHNGYQLQFLPDPPSRTYIKLYASSSEGLQKDVLDATAGKAIIRHLFRKYGSRLFRR